MLACRIRWPPKPNECRRRWRFSVTPITTSPWQKGEELARLAKAVGAPAEQVTYPGRAHGFDVSDTDPMTASAIGRGRTAYQGSSHGRLSPAVEKPPLRGLIA